MRQPDPEKLSRAGRVLRDDLGALWVNAMRRGDFRAAWAINDAVLKHARRPDDPELPYHLRFVWDGRPFEGRNVLVRCYHGLGDTLQFLCYLPALRCRTASLAMEAQPELLPLLNGFPGVDRLIPFRVEAPAAPSDCDLEIMELPHALRLQPPTGWPYLSACPKRVIGLRRRLGMSGEMAERILGVCCQAGDWDPERSIPPAKLKTALSGIPGLRLIRLQRSPCPELPWTNPGDRLDDIQHTAALVALADLVITADTMIAHLAGAMGRKVWLVLKAYADWRWMEGRSDSPWYPTMRLYRQDRAGDWSHPLARVAVDLAGWAGMRHGDAVQQAAPELSSFIAPWERSPAS
jgi:hypothetical protein